MVSRRRLDAEFVVGAEKEGAKERAVHPLAEGEAARAHRGGERHRVARRQFLIRPHQRVPIGYWIHAVHARRITAARARR